MESAIAMTVGRLIFSAIDRREVRLVALEVASGLVFLALCVYLLTIDHVVLRSIALGALFLVTGLATRLLTPRDPIEAPVTGSCTRPPVAIGIIDFSWLSVMAAALAIVEFTQGRPPLSELLPPTGLRAEYYTTEIETCRMLLSHTINGVFAVGAILAACMGILWAGEIWRGRQGNGIDHYRITTLAAIKMAIAFLFVFFVVLGGIGVPLYDRIHYLTMLLRE